MSPRGIPIVYIVLGLWLLSPVLLLGMTAYLLRRDRDRRS